MNKLLPILTTNVLYRMLWLGGLDNNGEVSPAGTGFMAEVDGKQYVVTAHHVYKDCQDSPRLRHKQQWTEHEWGDPVVNDKENDITVLRRSFFNIPDTGGFRVEYGAGDMLFGQLGYAVGFPGVLEKGRWTTDHVLELENRPAAISTLLTVNYTPGTDVVYCASYVNSGYSGGVVTFPEAKTGKWKIAGIITHFKGIPREVMTDDSEQATVMKDGKRHKLWVMQHNGLLGYRPWNLVQHLIKTAER